MSSEDGPHGSEDGEISRRGDEKRKGEADTPFHNMKGPMNQTFAHSPHLEKRFASHMEKILQ